jgi:hypothetical protein
VVEPEQAEALALLRAVQLAQEEGLSKVIFTLDCLPLVQRVRSSSVDRSPVGVLVSLAKSFTSVTFIHVKRCLNEAAHVLAKSCINFTSSEVFRTVPECIRGTRIDVI